MPWTPTHANMLIGYEKKLNIKLNMIQLAFRKKNYENHKRREIAWTLLFTRNNPLKVVCYTNEIIITTRHLLTASEDIIT